MKKFHFTLDKMLRYKDSILEEEKNRLMQKKIQLIHGLIKQMQIWYI